MELWTAVTAKLPTKPSASPNPTGLLSLCQYQSPKGLASPPEDRGDEAPRLNRQSSQDLVPHESPNSTLEGATLVSDAYTGLAPPTIARSTDRLDGVDVRHQDSKLAGDLAASHMEASLLTETPYYGSDRYLGPRYSYSYSAGKISHLGGGMIAEVDLEKFKGVLDNQGFSGRQISMEGVIYP